MHSWRTVEANEEDGRNIRGEEMSGGDIGRVGGNEGVGMGCKEMGKNLNLTKCWY